MTEPAPYHYDVAEGPEDAFAVWLMTTDEVRVRAAVWPTGTKGTILLFNGRTECVEKYGRTASIFAAHGFAMASLDWRGQGLSDRLTPDPNLGHVRHFLDYQRDVATLVTLLRDQGLPEPWYLIGHSMGGAIGLRALLNELPVRAALFSAPMWGIAMSPLTRPFAWGAGWLARQIGLAARYAPSTVPALYLTTAAFDHNDLTHDPEIWDYMVRQVSDYPALGLGGPSLHWLHEALIEMRDLMQSPPPSLPVLTGLGSDERIVDPAPIRKYVTGWDGAQMVEFQDARHELLMEIPEIRDDLIARTVQLFLANP